QMRIAARNTLGIEIEVATPEADNPVPASDHLTAAETSAQDTDALAFADSIDEAGISGAAAHAAPEETATGTPVHDLVVNWRGMHWDTTRKAALMQLVRDLRLPATRSPNPAPTVVEDCFQVPGSPIALAVYLSEAGNADRNEAFRWLTAAAEESSIPADKIH